MVLLFSFMIQAKEVKVAILDTGIKREELKNFKVCDNGLKDFTGEGIEDIQGHGTNIALTILKYNKNPNVCFMFIKIFSEKGSVLNSIAGFIYAMENNVSLINYSGGGDDFDLLEKRAVNLFLDRGGILIAAAGNKHRNLNVNCSYFPACYSKRIFTISNNEIYSNIYKNSIKVNYDGESGSRYHGTSQSTARTTALFLNYAMKIHLWK